MEAELQLVVEHLTAARDGVARMMDQTANDPRMALLARDVTCLWHELLAADFTLLRVRKEWKQIREKLVHGIT